MSRLVIALACECFVLSICTVVQELVMCIRKIKSICAYICTLVDVLSTVDRDCAYNLNMVASSVLWYTKCGSDAPSCQRLI